MCLSTIDIVKHMYIALTLHMPLKSQNIIISNNVIIAILSRDTLIFECKLRNVTSDG